MCGCQGERRVLANLKESEALSMLLEISKLLILYPKARLTVITDGIQTLILLIYYGPWLWVWLAPSPMPTHLAPGT